MGQIPIPMSSRGGIDQVDDFKFKIKVDFEGIFWEGIGLID